MTKKTKIPTMPEVAPAEPAANPYDPLAACLAADVEGAEGSLAEWCKGFREDPSNAFEWCGNAMRSAARLRVAKQIAAQYRAGVALDKLVEFAMSNVLFLAQNPRDGEPMLLCYLSEWARWAENLPKFKEIT